MYRCSVRSGEKLIKNKSLLYKVKNGNIPLKTPHCYNSSRSASGGGSGLYVGATITTLGALIGGTTTYAGYDHEFRKSVEDAVPFSKTLFSAIHGEIKEKKALAPVEIDLSIPFEPEVLPEDKVIEPLFFRRIQKNII